MVENYFEAREKALLGQAYEALYEAPKEICRGLTVNTLRCEPRRLLKVAPEAFALTDSPFCKEGFLLHGVGVRPGHWAYHHAGAYYVQEPSASCAAPMLCVQPGDRVLDVCAAPGGKTAQLAAALQGKGVLVANEFILARAQILRGNLERLGVSNALVLSEDTARLAACFAGCFDKVLVDAPCSGEGMFRKEPEALRQHSQGLVNQCAALGAQVLENAAACVAAGGLLAYATCTFSAEENEGQLAAFLQKHADFELLPAPVIVGKEGEAARVDVPNFNAAYTRRIYPCHGGEGHFLALLQRKGEASVSRPFTSFSAKQMPAPCKEFLQAYFPALAQCQSVQQGNVTCLVSAEMPDTGKYRLRTVQTGVQVGSVEKGRFVPAHHLFMVYGQQCTNQEALCGDDPRVAAWLRGEEIEAKTAQAGYAAVLVDGLPLGFGKQSGGRLKNHYPKGLRNLK